MCFYKCLLFRYYIWVDFTKDLPNDLMDVMSTSIYESDINNNVFYFGYTFKDNVSRKDRTTIINYIKGIGENRIDNKTLRKLIAKPIRELDRKIGLSNFSCFVYPVSSRSNINLQIVDVFNDMLQRDIADCSYKLIKNGSDYIDFDYNSLERHLYNSDMSDKEITNQLKQIHNYVDNELLPKIHNLNYFSIARDVKPKYRKYIKNYLHFQDSDLESLKNSKFILIMDDIATSGATLMELLRQVTAINPTAVIYIFTLIGKDM